MCSESVFIQSTLGRAVKATCGGPVVLRPHSRTHCGDWGKQTYHYHSQAVNCLLWWMDKPDACMDNGKEAVVVCDTLELHQWYGLSFQVTLWLTCLVD